MNSEPENRSESQWIIWLCVFAAACVVLGIWSAWCGYHDSTLKGHPGDLGSFLQGTTGSLWSLAGFFIISVAFLAQRKQLLLQNDQFEHEKQKRNPILLSIEKVSADNSVVDLRKFGEDRFKQYPQLYSHLFSCYCHHLRVRNLSTHAPIKNCRVWLKKVEVERDGQWKEENMDLRGQWGENRFAVPRLMEWAPSEYSRVKRTFYTEQVFDFGQTLSLNTGFLVTIWRKQGGNFNALFPAGTKARFYFYATADNYVEEKVFCVEIDVLSNQVGGNLTPSKIRVIG